MSGNWWKVFCPRPHLCEKHEEVLNREAGRSISCSRVSCHSWQGLPYHSTIHKMNAIVRNPVFNFPDAIPCVMSSNCLDPNITGFTTYTWVEVEASRASPAHDAGTLPDLVIPRMVGIEMRRERDLNMRNLETARNPCWGVLGNLQPFEPPLHYSPGLSLIALT
jgi:hypothetical protein